MTGHASLSRGTPTESAYVAGMLPPCVTGLQNGLGMGDRLEVIPRLLYLVAGQQACTPPGQRTCISLLLLDIR